MDDTHELRALIKTTGYKPSTSEYQLLHSTLSDKIPPKGDVVLAMGGVPHALLTKLGILPKNRKISSLRYPKQFSLPDGRPLFLTYSANTKEFNHQLYVMAQIDTGVLLRWVATGSLKPTLGEYEWMPDLRPAIKEIKERYRKTGKVVPVALDTETLGLDPFSPTGRLLSIQVSVRPGHAYVIPIADINANPKWHYHLLRQLDSLLNSPKVLLRCANGKFDMSWIWRYFKLESTNFKFDTMLVGSLLDENRANDLNTHCKVYAPELGGYDDDFNKKYDKARMDLVPHDEFLTYSGGDADACYRVADAERAALLEEPRLARFYVNILHPAARAFEQVERYGLPVDVPYYEHLENEIKTEMAGLAKEAMGLLPKRFRIKYKDSAPNHPTLLTEYLFSPAGLGLTPKMFTEKAKKPSTSGDHLNMFSSHPKAQPFIERVLRWQDCRKTLTTYVCKRDGDGKIVGGFLSHLRSDDRYHPNYFFYNGGEDEGGTNTGRLSARDPAIQTVPKHTSWAKKLRRAFIAPPGMLYMANDYAQGELKIAACLANEPTMLKAYQGDFDLHALTVCGLMGWELTHMLGLADKDPQKFDFLRRLGKATNFGLIYGMGIDGYISYAALNYGVMMTYDEGEQRHNRFFETYDHLRPWHKRYRNYAKAHGYIWSPLGRKRHLPLIHSFNEEIASKALRQAVNAPVQSTLSDLLLWAISLIKKRGLFKVQPVVGAIHDQALSFVLEDNWEIAACRAKETMENLPFHQIGWKPQLKFTVDCEIGPNLGEMHKQKVLPSTEMQEKIA